MSETKFPQLSIATATGRWAKLGPYYAMFPVDFAFEVIEKYSEPGHAILDPFAGRASSVYAAAVLQRSAIGIEINSVGWLYGKVKLATPSEEEVVKRIEQLGLKTGWIDKARLDAMPEFFRLCYTDEVLRFLLVARTLLKWEHDIVDATVMAIILVHLHGKIQSSLSNQMRQGKAMSPDYSVKWWKAKNSLPPSINPVEFMKKRVKWRYAKGHPCLTNAEVIKGDSTLVLKDLCTSNASDGFDLLFTSPPYYAITDYHYDQWLRLWMLGGNDHPVHFSGASVGRFSSKPAYRELIEGVFMDCAQVMRETATIYVRTDARSYTYETTLQALKKAFPDKVVETVNKPFKKNTQTALYGDKTPKPGEIDIILRAKRRANHGRSNLQKVVAVA